MEIPVAIMGVPSPTATWSKANVTLETSDKYTVTTTTENTILSIRDLQPEDAAPYTVTVDNVAGKATKTVTLAYAGKL